MTLDVKSIPQIILKQTYKSKQKKYNSDEKLLIYRRNTFLYKSVAIIGAECYILNVNKIWTKYGRIVQKRKYKIVK